MIPNAREEALALLARLAERGQIEPQATGVRAVDDALAGGLRNGMNALGGMPGVGKTSFTLQVVLAASKRSPALFFTAEQRPDEHLARLLAAESGHRLTDLLDGQPQAIADAYQALDVLPFSQLHIVADRRDSRGSIATLRQAIDDLSEFYGAKPFTALDYLQRLMPPQQSNAKDLRMSILLCSMGITNLVRDLDLTVLVVSALNRASYREQPALEAFKESGSIEYDSDVAMILRKVESGSSPSVGVSRVELHIVKNRTGAITTDPIRLLFDGRLGSFQSDTSSRAVSSVRPSVRPSVSEVVTALRVAGGEWPTLRAVVEALGCSPLAAGQALKRAKDAGYLREVEGPGGARRFLLESSKEDAQTQIPPAEVPPP
jgi:replicative DNA helicase